MSVTEPAARLDLECREFSRYLAGRDPSEAARAYYVRAHRTIPYLTGGEMLPVDRGLLAAARRGGFLLRAADAYGRFFRPAGPLRQKLVLCLAILENSPDTHEHLNSAEVGPTALVLARLVGAGIVAGLALVTGMLAFGPQQLLSRPEAKRA